MHLLSSLSSLEELKNQGRNYSCSVCKYFNCGKGRVKKSLKNHVFLILWKLERGLGLCQIQPSSLPQFLSFNFCRSWLYLSYFSFILSIFRKQKPRKKQNKKTLTDDLSEIYLLKQILLWIL